MNLLAILIKCLWAAKLQIPFSEIHANSTVVTLHGFSQYTLGLNST